MAKNIDIKNRIVRIQIWDTAGQEAFRSITRTYYKSSTCAFIVYDITDKKSFENVLTWLNECRDMCYKDILICLIGNKSDLESKRVISYEEGKNFAEENNLLFFETSAKDGTNIKECFNESATVLVDKIENGQLKLDVASNGIQIGNFPDSEQNEKLRKKKKELFKKLKEKNSQKIMDYYFLKQVLKMDKILKKCLINALKIL